MTIKPYGKDEKIEIPFEKGDVVKLKSGSPSMTIEGVNIWGKLICVWFTDEKENKSTFDHSALKK